MSNTEPKIFKKFLGFSFSLKKIKPVNFDKKNISETKNSNPYVNEGKSDAFRLHQEQINRKIKQKEVKEKIDNLFNSLLYARDEPKALMILDRGYQIDSEQAIRLMDINFKDPKFKEAILKRYDSHIKHEIFSDIEEIIKRLSTPYKGFYESYESDEYDEEQSHGRQPSVKLFINKATCVWEYINQMNNLKEPEYALKFRDQCNKIKEFLTYHYDEFDFEGDLYFSNEKFEKLLDSYISFIEKEHQSTILDKFSQELDSYALGFNNFETVKENMVSGMLESVKKFNEFDLPLDAQKLMNDITEVSNEITPHTLSVEQTLEFNNLYKKRFPQVLEEYVSISPRYREKLKNHDENPDNILMDSLVEIKGKLDDIFDVVQGNKYTRQYLKNM